MSIERLTGNLDFDRGDRFIFYYGAVNDEFCDSDCRYGNIGFMLWRAFRERGYRRIVFFDGAAKLHFLDPESESLTRIEGGARRQGGAGQTGPLGRRTSLGRSGAQRDNAQAAGQVKVAPGAISPMNDLNAFEMIDHIHKADDNIPTAMIFPYADEICAMNYSGKTFQVLQNLLVQWARRDLKLPNLSVFVFQQTKREDMVEICKNHGLHVLKNCLEQKGEHEATNVIRVAGPDQREFLNAVHHTRLADGMAVDWLDLDRFADWAAAENRPLAYWRSRLADTSRLDRAAFSSWLSGERSYSDQTPLQRLDELIGLKAVKEAIRKKVETADFFRNRNISTTEAGSLHMAFLGNPGTGKTEVAGLVGEIFREAGLLLRGHTVVAENRAALVAEYEGQSAHRTNDRIDEALNGVLFIDEAHQLIREEGSDPFGKEAVQTLVARMERERNRLCVIVAGYPGPIRRLIASDPGLKRRVNSEILFEDYTPAELCAIFRLMATKKAEKGLPPVTEETMAAVAKVLTGMYETRNLEDWGNAGVVRNLLDDMIAEGTGRMGQAEHYGTVEAFLPEDIPEKHRIYLGIELNPMAILAELNTMVGLKPVKEEIAKLIETVYHEQWRQVDGCAAPERRMMHMLFLGSPGTGKTETAKLMGRVFKGLGLLTKGHVVLTNGGELAGSHVGDGLEKTRAKIREALGGILFIDEIYGLTQGSLGQTYGADIINNILVPAMVDRKESLVVIGAGYTQAIKEFLRANVGLNSRFVRHLEFPDFNAVELYEIFIRHSRRQGYALAACADKALCEAFAAIEWCRPDGFGNARTVLEDYFAGMLGNLASRTNRLPGATAEDRATLLAEDLPAGLKALIEVAPPAASVEAIIAEVEAMVGLGVIKQFVAEQIAYLRAMTQRKSLGLPPVSSRSLHMVFTGNPGTGKTTVARQMGRIFKALGILARGHLVETDRAGLVAGYVGQTADKAEKKIREALDGVLFIDEAYGLSGRGSQDYGPEAIEKLIMMMENHRDRLVVIVAGYPEEMRQLIAANPGLESRFTEYIHFEDYNADELAAIFMTFCKEGRFELGPRAMDRLGQCVEAMWANRDRRFANGRAVRNFFQQMVNRQSARVSRLAAPTTEALCAILPEDFPEGDGTEPAKASGP